MPTQQSPNASLIPYTTLFRSHRVEYVESVDEELIKDAKTNWIFRILFFLALIIIIFLLFRIDRKSTRLNSSHVAISFVVFCLIKNIYIIIKICRLIC